MNMVNYHAEDRIGYITLNRPDKRNALSPELIKALSEAFDRATRDEQSKVIVLKANGEAFCSGADLAFLQQMQAFSEEENYQDSSRLKELFLKIYTLPKVVIAQVQGHALAGGCGLANVCDFTFAVPQARFGYTEVKIGFVPAIVMVFLLRKLGEQKAKQLLLSGDVVQADEALRLGLINRVVSADQLEHEVREFAQQLIRQNSAQSMMLTKQMMAAVQSKPLDEALDYAARLNARARSMEDCQRGIAAFLAKEKIVW
ncbi:MAG: enoyl-CoA hydratase/isomerase family protein [Cyclobacteriaceae bacterium]|nr:enoyl-CoA hydratase/isomerase family protein [Cyclobacteriaceae bacterium]